MESSAVLNSSGHVIKLLQANQAFIIFTNLYDGIFLLRIHFKFNAQNFIKTVIKVRFENNNFVLVNGRFGVDLTRYSINIQSPIQTIHYVKTLDNGNFVKSQDIILP